MMRAVEQAVRQGLKPVDGGPPWKWAEKNVEVDNTSPMPGKWRSVNSPWVREVMEAFADNRVKDISIMCSAQSAKTQTIMNCALWAISEDPGPMMWVMAAKDEAASFVRTRLGPMVDSCAPVASLLPDGNRFAKQTLEMNFKTMPLFVTGANAPSKLQSKPIRWLLLDEVRNYPPGALDMVLKRTRSFWNARRVIISTPDAANDAVHRAFLEGDRREWHFDCPACKQAQQLTFRQLKWDTNEHTKPGGVWNFDRVTPTIRYECVACGHAMRDVPSVRNHIMQAGRWIRTNPDAPRHRVSFHWNAMLPKWVEWRSLVEEKIMADRALRLGDPEPLKAFINESLGEPWEDKLREFDDFSVLEDRRSAFTLGETWADEAVRFLAIDVQKDHMRFVCRAFGKDKRTSRLVAYGRAANADEMEAIRMKLNVETKNTVIDSAHDSATVYKICLMNKWKAFRGDDRPFFMAAVEDGEEKKTVRRVWALSHADPGIGTSLQGKSKPIKLYLWSNPGVKDILALAMSGLEQIWQIAADAGADYFREMTAEERVELVDAKGRVRYEWQQRKKDNHYFDCECMVMASAIMSGKVGRIEESVEAEETEEPEAKAA